MFLYSQTVYTGPGAPSTYSVGTGLLSPECRDLELTTPSNAEMKNEWAYFFTPTYAFMVCT